MKPEHDSTDSLAEKASELGHDVVDKASEIAEDARVKLAEIAKEARIDATEKIHELSKEAKAEYAKTIKSPKKMRIVKIIGIFLAGWLFGIIIAAMTGAFSDNRMDHDDMMGGHDMGAQMHTMSRGLDGLSGSDLEQKFLTDMIVHHEGAVDMATIILNDAKNIQHPEMIQMATSIIKAQTGEIAQMNNWLNSWYPVR